MMSMMMIMMMMSMMMMIQHTEGVSILMGDMVKKVDQDNKHHYSYEVSDS
jgi:hypothetical protein